MNVPGLILASYDHHFGFDCNHKNVVFVIPLKVDIPAAEFKPDSLRGKKDSDQISMTVIDQDEVCCKVFDGKSVLTHSK